MNFRAALSVCASVVTVLTLASTACGAPTQVDPAPVVLENGARVIVMPVAGASRVAVEVVYRVGSLHEPAGMPQLAHLVEHLTCYGATGELKEGEAFATGEARGSINAETLADITRYEHEAPVEDLKRILTVEADRLRAVTFTAVLLAQESPRVDQEAGFVEASPMAPLLKYAFVAGPQAWFHQRNETALTGATKAFDLPAAENWRTSWYRPDRLTVVIVGGVEAAAAVQLARDTIGAVPKPRDPVPPAPDWRSAPRRAAVKWTSNHRAIVIAFEPPTDPVERLALTVLGDVTLEQLARDPQVQSVAAVAITSNRTWPVGVGDLPLFVYATITPGVDAGEAERVITDRFVSTLRERPASGMLAVAIASLIPPPVPTWEQAQAQGKQVFANRPGFAGDPGGTVLQFHALQAAARERLNSPPTAIGAARALTADQVKALAERVTAQEKKFVTTFGP